ncbi:hypothetical protein HHK36_017790 [Tetracentron sinense]|uniref:HSF-type DNA-binding domain-containing protein n=1 Tax=Tetracentron sinense TaxID=13715 RepID=A0A834YXS9_TETSI|nr:hypothetical protein HHK36_017790 [Tetracentron sinense]
MFQPISIFHECEEGLLDYVRKSSPPPFLLKTHMLVEDPATDDIISWNADGTAFVVWQQADFSRDLLPTLFKHSNFSSFIRQLNTYGFRKVTTSRWEFYNDMFRRGEPDLLCKIRRKKARGSKLHTVTPSIIAPQESDEERGSSATSSSSGYSGLVDENRRLKRENGVLSSELMSMKRKCKELVDLVAMYKSSEKIEEDIRPKLFGVRLEVPGERKGRRVEIISEIVKVSLSHVKI